jgi:hypothetical protein
MPRARLPKQTAWSSVGGIVTGQDGGVTQKPPRRHHVVNRAYLARFARDGMLQRVPLAGTPHLISMNNATVERDFYSTSAPGLEVDAYALPNRGRGRGCLPPSRGR